uniref:Uncharacterized protein n=1 Tax=viral metagenome TaxID=1070528 RepID=A0A6C0D294_9ZZZZ
MSNTDINDIRTPAQFKGFSFSKFKCTDAKNQFILNMQKGRLEPACYWCAELVCSGHYMEIWETLLYYAGKHIHLGNPKIIMYLEMRYEVFKNIMAKGDYLNELQLRNNPTIRQLFAEAVSVLTLSNKKSSIEPIKINREEEFDMTQMTERLIAPNVHFIEPFFQKKDPNELIIALNEFAYNISHERHNMHSAMYWIEWVIEFDLICRKRKTPCHCERRTTIPVEKKYQCDIIWIIWDALFHYCDLIGNVFIRKLMDSLLSLFCIKYTTAACKRRRYLLYMAIALLTEPVPVNIELMPNKPMVQNVVSKIHEIYKQIKKNEESPNTDYLFNNLEQQNTFEQSIKRMELVNSLDIFK